jgi:hypothetical protein
MDELRDKLPPTFSSAATGHLFTSTVRTTMAGDGRETTMHKVTAPQKGMPLIEEGFPDFAFVAAPPPRWHNGRHRRRASSAAAKRRPAWPPKEEKEALIEGGAAYQPPLQPQLLPPEPGEEEEHHRASPDPAQIWGAAPGMTPKHGESPAILYSRT